MIARRYAAGELEIDDPVVDAIAAHDLGHHHSERAAAHRHGDLELGERTLKASQMRLQVDEASIGIYKQGFGDEWNEVGDRFATWRTPDSAHRQAHAEPMMAASSPSEPT